MIATVLSLLIFWFLSFGVSTLIYTTSFLSSLPYTWTADGLCWSLSNQPPPEVFEGGCKAEILLFRYHFLINAARELATEHSMWWYQLSLRYFWVLILLVRLQCTFLSLELRRRSPWLLRYTFELCLAYPSRYSSSDHLLIRTSLMRFQAWPIHYHLFVLGSSHSRPKPKAQYMSWALNPTITPQKSSFFLLIRGKKWGFDFLRINTIFSFDLHTWECRFACPIIVTDASKPVRRH